MSGKSEKVRIMVAFGDISGFTSFCDAVTNDEVEYDPFMDKFDRLLEKAERDTGYSFTDTGDGFMCIIDLPVNHGCTMAIEALKYLWILLKKIQHLIETKKELDPPAPEGFRIVGTAGYVKRKIKRDGRIIHRGKYINKAHNYLDQARGKGFVCHDSLKNLISDRQAKKNGLQFTRLENELWVLNVA